MQKVAERGDSAYQKRKTGRDLRPQQTAAWLLARKQISGEWLQLNQHSKVPSGRFHLLADVTREQSGHAYTAYKSVE